MQFNRSLNGQIDLGSGEFGRVATESRSVDDLAEEYGTPDVLFIDVEGYEGEVLAGAAETLALKPDVFVEVHVGAGLEALGGSAEAVLATFPNDTYERFISPPSGQPISALTTAADELLQSRFFLFAIAR